MNEHGMTRSDFAEEEAWEDYQRTKALRDLLYEAWCQDQGLHPDDPGAAYAYELDTVSSVRSPEELAYWRGEGYVA